MEDKLKKYYVSICIQGELDIINIFIQNTQKDSNLLLYSTFIQDILRAEKLIFKEYSKEESFFDEFDNKYYANIEINTEIQTKDINKLLILLRQDETKLNNYFQNYFNKTLDILVAAKQLSFNEENYIFVK